VSDKTIKARDILADMKAGFDDDALMQKYQVSFSQLQGLFKKNGRGWRIIADGG